MAQALPLTSYISQASSKSRKNRVLKAQFGDGYEQVAPDGINNKIDMWSIVYDNLSSTDRGTLWTFIDGVGSWDIVTWTPIGEGTQKKFRITPDGASEQVKAGNVYSVSFTLQQVF
jgi:phage-related protein